MIAKLLEILNVSYINLWKATNLEWTWYRTRTVDSHNILSKWDKFVNYLLNVGLNGANKDSLKDILWYISKISWFWWC